MSYSPPFFYAGQNLPISLTLAVNKFIKLQTNLRNILSQGHLADLIILQALTEDAKPTIAFKDMSGADVAWLAAHDYLLFPTTQHKHLSLETSDLAGELQTRLAIGYGVDQATLEIRSVNIFDLLDATVKVRSSGTASLNISRKTTANFGQLVLQTNEVDKWGVQMRNDATDHLYIRDVANGRTLVKALTTGHLSTRAPTAAITDANLSNNEISFHLNEAGNLLTIKAKYSSGTVKTGTVALV